MTRSPSERSRSSLWSDKARTHSRSDMGDPRPVTCKQHPDIDQGWAWVVVVAIFLYNFMVGGTLKSFGLFYVEFIHIFPDGPAKVGLIGLALGISSLLMSPLGGLLGDYIQCRWIALAGGIMLALSFASTAFAHNLALAIFTFGCLAGGTLGLIDGPILASLGIYFRRHRTMASGLTWTGSSVGNLVLAPLFAWLIKEYGIRGSVVLLGGIWLHTCVIGLLLRPLPKVIIRTPDSDQVKVKVNGEVIDQGQCKEVKEDDSTLVTEIISHSEIKPRYNCNTDGDRNNDKQQMNDQNEGSESLLEYHEMEMKNVKPAKEAAADTSLKDGSNTESGYISFIKNARMWHILLVLGFGFFGYYAPFVVIPLWAEELSVSKTQVSIVIGLIGLIEVVTRVILGIIIDLFKLRVKWVMAIAFFGIGTTGIVISLLPEFKTLIGYACVHGIMGGVPHIVMATQIGEVVRVERMGSAMGLVVMQLHIASASVTFTSGIVKELTGSYSHMIQISSAAYLVGAVLCILGPLKHKIKLRCR